MGNGKIDIKTEQKSYWLANFEETNQVGNIVTCFTKIIVANFSQIFGVRWPKIFTLEPKLCLKVYDRNLGDMLK